MKARSKLTGESKRRKMDERASAESGSSDDASCSSEDDFLALSENKDAEGIAENIQRTFLAAMRATHPDESSNRPLRYVGNSARVRRRKAAASRCAAAGCCPLTKYWASGEVNTNQADEAYTMETATVQDFPLESDEEEESLWSKRILENAIEQLVAMIKPANASSSNP